jgi:hypothetical protein
MALQLISYVDGGQLVWMDNSGNASSENSLTSPKRAQSQYSKNHSDSNALFPRVEVDDSTQLVKTSLNLVVTTAKVPATSVEGSGQRKES